MSLSRSESVWVRGGRWQVVLLATIVVVAAALGIAAAPASAAGAKSCAAVSGKTSGVSWAQVEVINRRGVSCAGARKVIRQCLTRRKVKGWNLIKDRGNPGLRRGKRWLRVRSLGPDLPTCLERGRVNPRKPRIGGENARVAGPWEQPAQMPPTASSRRYWTTPVTSYSAQNIDVGAVTLIGYAHTNLGNVRSVWFEYGTTRDLGKKTDALPPQIVKDDDPWQFGTKVRDLKAKTRYYWRAVASIGSDDNPQVFHGTIGSFVTTPYRDMGVANPCSQDAFGSDRGGPTMVTTHLTVVCSPRMQFVNSIGLPVSLEHHGKLVCPTEYPKNLNASNTSFHIPEINYDVHFNDIVNYWRSNDSARFTTFFGYQKYFEGTEAGPLEGWHEWDIDHWGYLGSTSTTDVQLWINCTDNWQATTPAQLAPPQGSDLPSTDKPANPGGFKFERVNGGWKGSWNAVGNALPGGIAGYQLTVSSVDTGLEGAPLQVSTTGTEQVLPNDYIKAMSDIYRTKRLYAVLWAISSEGTRSAKPATSLFIAP